MRASPRLERRLSGLVLALVLALAAAVPVPDANAIPGPTPGPTSPGQLSPSPNNPIKIMAVGDSITQGREGDFTWRYRLWEWLQQTPPARRDAPRAAFVGPYNGTLPASVDAADLDPTNPQTWGAYHPSVHPQFWPGGGSAHFAVYGRPAWQAVDLLAAQVALWRPDYVLLHLGFNDLGWWGAGPASLLETVRRLVAEARRGRGDVRVLVADVSHRLLVVGREDIPPKTDEYDALLAAAVPAWSTALSPVELVRVREVFDCQTTSCPAGIDGLHPNALGDFQIAQAYTKVLVDRFGIGDRPLAVPKYIWGINAPESASSPRVGVFALVAVLCLVCVAAFRPEFLRARKFGFPGRGRYRIIPSR